MTHEMIDPAFSDVLSKYDHGNLRLFGIEGEATSVQAVLAEKFPVIRGHDEYRILPQSSRFHPSIKPRDRQINVFDLSIVQAGQLLLSLCRYLIAVA